MIRIPYTHVSKGKLPRVIFNKENISYLKQDIYLHVLNECVNVAALNNKC